MGDENVEVKIKENSGTNNFLTGSHFKEAYCML